MLLIFVEGGLAEAAVDDLAVMALHLLWFALRACWSKATNAEVRSLEGSPLDDLAFCGASRPSECTYSRAHTSSDALLRNVAHG